MAGYSAPGAPSSNLVPKIYQMFSLCNIFVSLAPHEFVGIFSEYILTRYYTVINEKEFFCFNAVSCILFGPVRNKNRTGTYVTAIYGF